MSNYHYTLSGCSEGNFMKSFHPLPSNHPIVARQRVMEQLFNWLNHFTHGCIRRHPITSSCPTENTVYCFSKWRVIDTSIGSCQLCLNRVRNVLTIAVSDGEDTDAALLMSLPVLLQRSVMAPVLAQWVETLINVFLVLFTEILFSFSFTWTALLVKCQPDGESRNRHDKSLEKFMLSVSIDVFSLIVLL